MEKNLKLNNFEKIEIPQKKDYISLNESLKKLQKSVTCQINAKALKGTKLQVIYSALP